MKEENRAYQLLLKALDQSLSPEEERFLDQALTESDWLREEQEKHLQVRVVFSQFSLSAAPDFTDELMSNLDQASAKVIPLFRFAPQIVAACVVLVLATLLTIYSYEGALSTEALLGVQDLSPEDAYTLLTY